MDALLSGMPIVQPAVPKQVNGFDCGVFALQYAEEMMVRWPECRFQVEGFSDKMFTLKVMKVSRHHQNIKKNYKEYSIYLAHGSHVIVLR